MIDVLEFSRHKAASALFVAFNVLAVILFVVGLILTTAIYVRSEPQSIPLPAQVNSVGARFLTQTAIQAQQLQQASDAMGWMRGASAAMTFTGYGFAGMVSLFLAQAIRYLAAIAEAAGKHAAAYLDVVDPKNRP